MSHQFYFSSLSNGNANVICTRFGKAAVLGMLLSTILATVAGSFITSLTLEFEGLVGHNLAKFEGSLVSVANSILAPTGEMPFGVVIQWMSFLAFFMGIPLLYLVLSLVPYCGQLP